MVDALWITLIGMGLVFVAILLLWGLMALLVRLTDEKEVAEEEEALELEQAAVPTDGSLVDRKYRAAAAAVAIALALRKPVRAGQTAQPAGSLSAWQAVNRANQISQRFNSSRKKVIR